MIASSGKIYILFLTVLLLVITGCSGTRPDSYLVGEGTQTQLRYLPVRDTDFIISVIGEELGLLGITIILAAFFFMLYWIITYAGIIQIDFPV